MFSSHACIEVPTLLRMHRIYTAVYASTGGTIEFTSFVVVSGPYPSTQAPLYRVFLPSSNLSHCEMSRTASDGTSDAQQSACNYVSKEDSCIPMHVFCPPSMHVPVIWSYATCNCISKEDAVFPMHVFHQSPRYYLIRPAATTTRGIPIRAHCCTVVPLV